MHGFKKVRWPLSATNCFSYIHIYELIAINFGLFLVDLDVYMLLYM